MLSLKKDLLLSFISVLIVVSPALAGSWSLDYGSEPGKVSVFNANTAKDFAEDQPYGPMSFRMVKNELWLLDSIGARLYCFDSENKLKKSIDLPGMPENLLLEDFALIKGSRGEPESVWVAEAAECSVAKISLANGKELLRIGGHGVEPGKFKQINQIEVDRTGRVYVGDIALAKIAIFTPYGELVREIPWQRSGFALDSHSKLHLLRFVSNAGYFLDVYSVKGQLEKSLHLGMGQRTNPRLWAVNSEGNIIVSFIPAGGFKGHLKLFEISEFAKIIRRLEFAPPTAMNRFLAGSASAVWIARADYFNAPNGKFIVESVNWKEKQ